MAKDLQALFAEVEKEEKAEREKLEKKLAEKREAALMAILKPLETERAELCQTVNAANTRIAEIDKEIAKFTGVKKKTKGDRKPWKKKPPLVWLEDKFKAGKKIKAVDLKDMAEGAGYSGNAAIAMLKADNRFDGKPDPNHNGRGRSPIIWAMK